MTARCRFVQVCKARSIFTCALRLPASEAMFVCYSFCNAGPAPSETAGGKFARARSSLPASAFGKSAWASTPSASHPPNNSFKPTRVVASATCYALRLHVSAAPSRVGLTQALGGRKTFVFSRILLAQPLRSLSLRCRLYLLRLLYPAIMQCFG